MEIGDAITVKARLTVYSAAGSTHSQGHQAAGARGIITAGPRVIGPTTWWRVNFTRSPDGWVKMPLILASNSRVIDPAPHVDLPPGDSDWTLIDGSPLAPSASIQHSTMLDGYAARPPWKVAGVDYAVGYPTATVLSDWRSIVAANVNVDVSGHIITISGSATVTLDSIDFSLGSGCQIHVTSTGTTNITNSKFITTNASSGTASIVLTSDGSGSINFSNNVVDGTGSSGAAAGMITIANGASAATLTIKYNWIRLGTHDDMVNVSSNQGGALTINCRWNLFEGGTHSAAQHGDWLQTQGVGSIYTSIVWDFNTYLTQADTGGSQGVMFTSNNATLPRFNAIECSYNTMKVVAGSNVNYTISVAATELNGTATLQQNYIDITGIGVSWFGPGDAGGPYSGVVTKSGNINMSTGGALT